MGHAKLAEQNQDKFYPDYLKKVNLSDTDDKIDKPVLISMAEKNSEKKLKKFCETYEVNKFVDNYDEQYAELLLSKNAHLYRANESIQKASIRDLLHKHYGKKQPWQVGAWIYFPWKKELVHVLGEHDFIELRSIRNRDLITISEQQALADFKSACFGLSVGSAAALALAITGISIRKMKLIDGAIISGSNLNRILTGVSSVGTGKCRVIGRQIYEMNPYFDIEYFDKVTSKNIGNILSRGSAVNLVIDEIDDIQMKIKIRLEARKQKIPVIMATELGDTTMIDIERFDQEPDRRLFHGLVPEVDKLADNPPNNQREWTKHAISIIDPKNIPLKMQHSLLKIGTTIVTHPQLGSTVMSTGGALAFAAKSIALNHPIKSGRYLISLEKEFLADYKTRKYKHHHKKHTKIIKKAVNTM